MFKDYKVWEQPDPDPVQLLFDFNKKYEGPERRRQPTRRKCDRDRDSQLWGCLDGGIKHFQD